MPLLVFPTACEMPYTLISMLLKALCSLASTLSLDSPCNIAHTNHVSSQVNCFSVSEHALRFSPFPFGYSIPFAWNVLPHHLSLGTNANFFFVLQIPWINPVRHGISLRTFQFYVICEGLITNFLIPSFLLESFRFKYLTAYLTFTLTYISNKTC